jgi:hypothetical protein
MRATDAGDPQVDEVQHLPYRGCCAVASRPWRFVRGAGAAGLLDKLQQLPRLAERVQVFGGATVAEAYRIRDLIRDADGPDGDLLRLVNSGTIDRYRSWWGVKRCRYLGRSFLRPVIPAEREADLPEKRRQQGRTPKIIVAGMTRRLECIVDPHGILLAGKSTTVVCGGADLRLLLGILNSRLVSFYYSAMFGGNQLQGGYLRIGPPQLKTVPMPADGARSGLTDKAMIETVQRLLSLSARLRTSKPESGQVELRRQIDTADRRLDRLVYRLYELTDEEIRVVEEGAIG